MEHKKQLLNELDNLTSLLDIPFARRTDTHWILKNVAINNTDEKRIKKVISICQLLLKDETNG